jgi:nucleotide-binding universal stress UspA family protein
MKSLFAFEPFHQEAPLVHDMVKLMKQLTASEKEIEIGFVATRTESELNLAFDVPALERFSSYPLQKIVEILKKAKVSIGPSRIHVVDFPTLSVTSAVDRLLRLVKTKKSKLLALYTHGRKGYARYLMGSFAETAIHRSRVSLLIASPKANFSNSLKTIFFASDFSSDSLRHLKQLCKISKQNGSTLVVFHQAEPVHLLRQKDLSPESKSYLRKIEQKKTKIEKLCAAAKVKVSVHVTGELAQTSDLIIKTATKSKADLIAVSAKVGPAIALMGGSVARQVLRASDKPVLVLK